VNLRQGYLFMFWNYVEISLIAVGVLAVLMSLLAGVDSDEVKTKASQTNKYQDFYTLAAAKRRNDVLLAALLFFAWIKVRSTST